MNLQKILNLVGIVAGGFVPFLPTLKAVELVAGMVGNVVDEVTADGTVVTDEAGNVLTKEELAVRVQARFNQAIDTVTRISDRAQGELDRTN